MENNSPVCTTEPRNKWYNHWKFPLVPYFKKREGTEYNTTNYSFEWLFLKMWTLDAAGFELAVTISGHWGIGILAIIPYLRITVCIPFPDKWAIWLHKNTWRQPKKLKNETL